jgi:hypothetical protein
MDDEAGQVNIRVNLALLPFGQASLTLGFAHPERSRPSDQKKMAVTQVMPLMSSVISPGYARPACF